METEKPLSKDTKVQVVGYVHPCYLSKIDWVLMLTAHPNLSKDGKPQHILEEGNTFYIIDLCAHFINQTGVISNITEKEDTDGSKYFEYEVEGTAKIGGYRRKQLKVL